MIETNKMIGMNFIILVFFVIFIDSVLSDTPLIFRSYTNYIAWPLIAQCLPKTYSLCRCLAFALFGSSYVMPPTLDE